MAYLKNKHLANIKKWNLDLSKYKDGVYDGTIYVPYDIKEFSGFKETFGFEIKEVRWGLYFDECIYLTSVSNLPEKIGWFLYLENCTSLTSISNLPEYVGSDLYFYYCDSLTFIEKMPSVVKDKIYTSRCPFFENLTEEEIREKYGILKE